MAGSYSHATNDDGSLRDPLDMQTMLENGGDCYEAIEEMYGMVWELAHFIMIHKVHLDDQSPELLKEIVDTAQKNYKRGVEFSPTDRPAMY
jgi:hypothetical protein